LVIAWPLRSVSPVSDARGVRPVNALNRRRAEPLRPAHRGDQQRRANLGDPGQAAGLFGQPLAGPHPPVQAGPRAVSELQRLQPARVDQRQPGQGLGVDGVGLGVPGQEAAQVGGLGRRHPEHGVAAAGEECGGG
jgi:hypothetical protein